MWYPDAIAKPIPPGSNDPVIIPVGCVLHVAVFEGKSLFDFFDGPSGGIESTWYIRYDGTVEQYRSTTREADANYRGNSWLSGGRRYGLHSVETEGLEHGEWTQAQIESIKKLLVWDAREHEWPLQIAPDWTGPGVGYHVMWGAPGPWTPVAKTCPGPDRVRQFKQIIEPWLAAGGQEDWLTMADRNDVKQAVIDALDESLPFRAAALSERVTNHDTVKARWLLEWGWYTGERNERKLVHVLANQRAIMQSQGVEVDEEALAAEIAAVLVPAVLAALPDTALTPEQVEQAVRSVLGSLDDA